MAWFHRDIGGKARLSLTDFAVLRTHGGRICILCYQRIGHIQTLRRRAYWKEMRTQQKSNMNAL
jgi:hypothetical protein